MVERDGCGDLLIESVVEQLRDPVPLSARVEETVLTRLRAGQSVTPERRLLRRRARIGSPIAGLALAAGLAGIFWAGVLVGRRQAIDPGVAVRESAPGGAHVIEFVVRTRADSAVAIVGDFNNWDPRATPLRSGGYGLWTVAVPLRPGRYRYTFVVDGKRWLRDPFSPPALEEDFGAPTSVITIAQR